MVITLQWLRSQCEKTSVTRTCWRASLSWRRGRGTGWGGRRSLAPRSRPPDHHGHVYRHAITSFNSTYRNRTKYHGQVKRWLAELGKIKKWKFKEGGEWKVRKSEDDENVDGELQTIFRKTVTPKPLFSCCFFWWGGIDNLFAICGWYKVIVNELLMMKNYLIYI